MDGLKLSCPDNPVNPFDAEIPDYMYTSVGSVLFVIDTKSKSKTKTKSKSKSKIKSKSKSKSKTNLFVSIYSVSSIYGA